MMASFITVQSICFGVLCALLLYTLWLMRTSRLNAHVTVRWILAEGTALVAICVWRWLPIFGYTSSLGDRELIMMLAVIFFALITFLMLDSLMRISTHTHQIKRLSQELALLREQSEGKKMESTAAPSVQNELKRAPEPAHKKKPWKWLQLLGCVWMVSIFYLAVLQVGLLPKGNKTATFFTIMTAQYLQ